MKYCETHCYLQQGDGHVSFMVDGILKQYLSQIENSFKKCEQLNSCITLQEKFVSRETERNFIIMANLAFTKVNTV